MQSSEGWALENGWRAFELSILQPSDTALQLLRSNGLSLGTSALSANFVGVSPPRYDENARGERFPCFGLASKILVEVRSPKAFATADIYILLIGPTGTLQKSPGAGERWLLELEATVEGRYVLEVVPVETEIERVRLFFTVENTTPIPLAATAQLTLAGTNTTIDESTALSCDLSALEESALQLKTPPLWPVLAKWEGLQSHAQARLMADENGAVDLTMLLKETRRSREEEKDAALFFDLGELGTLRLVNQREFSAADFFGRLEKLWRERQLLLSAQVPEPILFQQWLEPICRLLGYQPQQLPGKSAALLWQRMEGRPKKSRALLFVSSLTLPLPPGTQELARELCREHQLTQVIVTDGLRWAPFELSLAPMFYVELSKLFEANSEMLCGMMLQCFLAR